MSLPLKIAFRYLFARKSYHVINMISGIGMAGMAIGTAALVVILSVFNGFNNLVSESLGDVYPDLVVRPATGKVFVPDSASFQPALDSDDVLALSGSLEEQAFLSYGGKQSLARVKGVDEAFEESSGLQGHLVDGLWLFYRGQRPLAVAGSALAASMGLNPRFVEPVEIYFPSRTTPLSMANPAASLRSVKALVSGVFSVNAELDAKLMLVPIGLMRELLEEPEAVSSVEIWTAPGKTASVQQELQAHLGPGYRVLDRYQQNASLYRMMRYEKLAIYLILIFVTLIIAFNILSSLRMLIIEKEGDMETLRSMGAPEPLLRRIFLLEGWLVSLVGMGIGLAIGVGFVLLQQRYGLIAMPGNFMVSAYPVALKASDLLWTVLGVGGVGYLMALIPSRKL